MIHLTHHLFSSYYECSDQGHDEYKVRGIVATGLFSCECEYLVVFLKKSDKLLGLISIGLTSCLLPSTVLRIDIRSSRQVVSPDVF